MAPPANNLIMSGTLMQSFRHLEHQNPSISLGDRGKGRNVQQFRNGRRNKGGMEQNTVDTIRVLISQYSLLHYITVKCSRCSLVKYQSNMGNIKLFNNTIHITLYWCTQLYNTLQTLER